MSDRRVTGIDHSSVCFLYCYLISLIVVLDMANLYQVSLSIPDDHSNEK